MGPLDSADRNEQPYKSVAFRRILVLAYPSLALKAFDIEADTIDFLGRGHIAFAENLVGCHHLLSLLSIVTESLR